MDKQPILIHMHFHRKRTGVSRSIENVFPYFHTKFNAFIIGYGVEGRKISLLQVLKHVFSKTFFVLHCHRNNEIFLALIFRLLGGNFKLVSTRHAETVPSKPTIYLLKKSDIVVVLTKTMQKTISMPSVIIKHGVNHNVFKPANGIPFPGISQKNVLSCVGRVREPKGQKVLLETAAPLLKNYPDWALAVIGKVDKIDFLKQLKRIVKSAFTEDQVYFISETPDIIKYYQASHSVIVPSFTEGFSLVCAEAMSCGCNVLASANVGIHSEIIADSESGYLFDIKNKQELTQLLENLFQGKLKHLGTNAQKVIAGQWSSEAEAANLMNLYDKILAGK